MAIVENMEIRLRFRGWANVYMPHGSCKKHEIKVRVYVNGSAGAVCPFHMLPCNLRCA
jgi:hypothetical protein